MRRGIDEGIAFNPARMRPTEVRLHRLDQAPLAAANVRGSIKLLRLLPGVRRVCVPHFMAIHPAAVVTFHSDLKCQPRGVARRK